MIKKTWSLILLLALAASCGGGDDYTYVPTPPVLPGEGSDDDKPTITDAELMDLVQEETFKYFWDFAEPNSGGAKERYHPDDPNRDSQVVTSGGTGFGLMAIIVGIERGFISRTEGVARMTILLEFLENADRFHGAWSHWINGSTGTVIPFSPLDDGGDLVETAFLVQGLICVKEYLKNGSEEEQALAQQADDLWKGVEWDWYTQNQNTLYWHWSPNNGFSINLELKGYNEVLITYVLAAASPDFGIEKEVYTNGWASNGGIQSSNTQYGLPLLVKHVGAEQFGGPLFWAHYSYLGLNPKALSDEYVDYWDVNVNHSKINYQYCVANPKGFEDYGEECWGLTASYSRNNDGSIGYNAHSPSNDTGIISPTAAISSIPYTPQESLKAMHYFYKNKDKLLGPAGFYDAFSPEYNFWVAEAYLAIDQGPQIIMIENHRTGLLWNLFMGNEEVQAGLVKLGF
ncbi:glucoamylase family protein [Allomuricauda taeanensis]|uniref:glucoamylase family protein n=1 Tax=Flagellimonas taeanensis TaxID=1005926 RepID=UPI002E7B6382|nr:glucoamylase family protein [Allomuricauda taeanensis]MEE1962692.1 glucoamylase family protein [Allomuricauda taeanensis]